MEYKGFSILHNFGQYKVIIDAFTEILCDTEDEAMQYIDAHTRTYNNYYI